MNRFSRVFAIAMLSIFGLWGCSRPEPTHPPIDRAPALEASLRTAQQNNAQLEVKLKQTQTIAAALELEIDKLQAALRDTTRERDDAQVSLRLRTTERDLSQTQYEGFRKSLKDLLTQADAVPASGKADANSGPVLFGSPMSPEFPRQN